MTYDVSMLNHLNTAIRIATCALIIIFAFGAGTIAGMRLDDPIDATTRSFASPAAHDRTLMHQGWGEGDCEEDEWFDSYACLHGDNMPSHDPRNQLTDYYYYI